MYYVRFECHEHNNKYNGRTKRLLEERKNEHYITLRKDSGKFYFGYHKANSNHNNFCNSFHIFQLLVYNIQVNIQVYIQQIFINIQVYIYIINQCVLQLMMTYIFYKFSTTKNDYKPITKESFNIVIRRHTLYQITVLLKVILWGHRPQFFSLVLFFLLLILYRVTK